MTRKKKLIYKTKDKRKRIGKQKWYRFQFIKQSVPFHTIKLDGFSE